MKDGTISASCEGIDNGFDRGVNKIFFGCQVWIHLITSALCETEIRRQQYLPFDGGYAKRNSSKLVLAES
jgi:hypothetical protein